MKYLKLIISIIGMFLFSCQPSPKADWILTHGHIITQDSLTPIAKAMAVKGDEIIAVGSEEEIMQFRGNTTTVTDLEGKSVVPGFIDAHCHPRPVYPFESIHGQVNVNPANTPDIESLIAELKRKADITPEGSWIMGGRYQHTKLGRHPTRHDLDLASTIHPISIRHSSGHLAVVNTKALEMAGITAQTPDPAGGAFDRDPDGMPNGVCRETAYYVVRSQAPEPAEPTFEEQKEGLLTKLNEYASYGVTTLSEAGIDIPKFRLYESLESEGLLPVRVQTMIREYAMDTALSLGMHAGYGSDWLRIEAIKFYHGNSLSGQTCWLHQPYDKINPKTGKKDYYGIPPARSQRTLDSLVAVIHENGFQAAIHANGDREIDMVLDAIEKALKKSPRKDHRHRIEHGSVANPNILERIKQMGIVYAPHSYIYEHGDKMKVYGSERWNWMHANKSAFVMGIKVAGNSDEPVSPAIPMLRIQSMTTRQTAEGEIYGPKQKVSVEEALYIWTMGSAYSLFEEDKLGSLSPGKKADFVVLEKSPLTTEKLSLKDIQVQGTVVGGKWVYQNNSR